MATNSNRLQSVVKLVNKPSVQPFNKPQARPNKPTSQNHGLHWEMTAPEAWDPKIQSLDDCDFRLDEQDLLLPFVYKSDPNNEIDWDAIRAQPHVANVVNLAAYKTAVVNLKKKKSEEDLEVDQEAIRKKYEALQGKYFTFFNFSFFI